MPIGVPELIIIAVIVALIFGVGKLGDIGKSLGRGIREFRQEVTPGTTPPANGSVNKVELIEESEQQNRVQ